MLAAALLALREGLEAALVVGIVLGYLRQIRRTDLQRGVWLGVVAATVASAAVAAGLLIVGAEFEGRAEQIFEGSTMLLAVAVLTWMIFWMRYQARFLRSNLEREVRDSLAGGQRWGLVMLSFFTFFREGVETALFLGAAAFADRSLGSLVGALTGLALAAVLGWAIYSGSYRLNIRRFFDATSVLLLLFAAGLFARAIGEFQEAGLLPGLVDHIWSTRALLPETSALGVVLRSLFGYNDSPSLLQVMGYVAYWVAVAVGLRQWTSRLVARRVNESTPLVS